MEQLNQLLLYWVNFVSIFFKLLSQHVFFQVCFLDSKKKKLISFKIFISYVLYEMPNIFETRTIWFISEMQRKFAHFTIFTCYCCVTWIVLIQWSLNTHSEHYVSFAVGQIELTWVQHGPVWFDKIQHTKNNIRNANANLVLWWLQRTNNKTGKPANLYHQKLLKKSQAWVNFVTCQ